MNDISSPNKAADAAFSSTFSSADNAAARPAAAPAPQKPEVPAHFQQFLGFDFGIKRTGCASGNRVLGGANPLPTIKSGKFHEVQKYIILTGHVLTPRLVVVNDAAWQKIPAADRKIVEEVMKTHMAWADEQIQKQEIALIDEFKAAGVTIIQPDVESFRKATLAVVPDVTIGASLLPVMLTVIVDVAVPS